MESVGVLGPVQVIGPDEQAIDIGGTRQRRLLAALAMHANNVVSIDALLDIVFEGAPTDAAERTLQSYVSRLRRVIDTDGASGDTAIERIPPGYVLRVEPDALDALIFEAEARAGAEKAASGDHASARAAYDTALTSWRGTPYAEFADEPWAVAESQRLIAVRATAIEGRAESELALGNHAEAVVELEQFVREEETRERPRSLLMLALYRSGRQAEALRVYQDYFAVLGEMGLEPSKELRELEQQIAIGDDELDAPAATGEALRGYQLFEELGHGAFSSVYRATQPSVGRDVAIKVIHPELANEPDFVHRFEIEAQTIARLEHPHIVPLYDFWRDYTGAYLVMRYVREGTAEQKLTRDGPWTVEEAARLVDEIGRALVVAHEAGVVHRDIKPANVFMDAEGNAYLGDFGIAVETSAAPAGGSASSRLDLQNAGSPLYAAPEQYRDGRWSTASDIYAFGLMLFELLTGRVPFDDSDSVDVLIRRKTSEEVSSVLEYRPDLPPAIDRVIATATAREPEQRFASMGEFVLAFREAVETGRVALRTEDELVRPRELAAQTLASLEAGGRQPYKGLAAFGEADADDFYGRADLADELFEHLSESRFLVVTGPSGSGKSSVVRAGLIPRIRRSGHFVSTITPGSHPMDEMENALSRISTRAPGHLMDQLVADERGLGRAVKQALPAEDSELVLIIDQFEELFTLAAAPERDQFLGALAFAVSDSNSRLRVVATLRADFYDRPLQHPTISELVRLNTVAVSPLSGPELEEAITHPAGRVGVAMEPALVAELVGEVTSQPASLPLLQYVLTETFDRRTDDGMTLEVYQQIGGIAGALAHRADQLIGELDSGGESEVRRLFTRLISLGEGAEDTRRRVPRSELATIDSTVIDIYGNARLLTFDRDPSSREPTVEVAHEALIREWPRLRSWLEEDREGLRILRHLGVAAVDWDHSARPQAELYRGGRLEAAEEWAEERAADLTELEADYLAASLDRRADDEAEERMRVRRLRRLVEVAAVIAVIALVAGAIAFQQQGRANDEADEAEIRRLASEAGFRVQFNRQAALLLAVEAFDLEGGGPVSVGALQQALTGLGSYLGTVGSGLPYASVDWLDNDRLVAIGPAGTAVIDSGTGNIVAEWPEAAKYIRVDPGDGALITRTYTSVADGLVALVSEVNENEVIVRDLADDSGTLLPPIRNDFPVDGIELSPTGRRLATIDETDILKMWDVDSGLVLWSEPAHAYRNFGGLPGTDGAHMIGYQLDPAAEAGSTTEKDHHHLRFSDDGMELISQESVLSRWDTEEGDPIPGDFLLARERPGSEEEFVTAPSLTYLGDWVGDHVIVHDQSVVSMVDVVMGKEVWTTPITDAADAYGLAKIDTVHWPQDETDNVWVLLTDGRVVTLDVDDGHRIGAAFDTQLTTATDLAISPDGRRAAVSSASGVGIFSLDGSRVIARAIERNGTHTGSITPDGSIVTQDYANGEESSNPGQMFSLDGAEPVPLPRPDDRLVQHSAGVGSVFKVVTQNFGLRLWDFETRDYLMEAPAIGIWSGQTADVDNVWLAVGTSSARGIVVYDVAMEKEVRNLPDLGRSVASLSFNRDRSRLAAANGRGRAMVWETENWTVVDTLVGAGGSSVVSLRYSPYADVLVTIDDTGNLAVRDGETHEIKKELVGGGSPNILDGLFFFAEDERYLVTAADGEARLWDMEAGVPIGDPFPNDANNRVNGADGLPRFVTAVGDSRLIWNLEIVEWRDQACQAAGRNLTREEWDQFGPDGPYRQTCEEWVDASAREEVNPGFPALEVTLDPALEALGMQALAPLIEALEVTDRGDATKTLCGESEDQLKAAGADRAEGTLRSGDFRTIVRAAGLCRGGSFDDALGDLTAVRDGDACVAAYPSPCLEPG
jgi:serine/threonine protein kinase/WD40 repeat protein/DNA-binding winged helix-turn-helix (wHTH) protein